MSFPLKIFQRLFIAFMIKFRLSQFFLWSFPSVDHSLALSTSLSSCFFLPNSSLCFSFFSFPSPTLLCQFGTTAGSSHHFLWVWSEPLLLLVIFYHQLKLTVCMFSFLLNYKRLEAVLGSLLHPGSITVNKTQSLFSGRKGGFSPFSFLELLKSSFDKWIDVCLKGSFF